MGRVNTPILLPEQRMELESGFKTGSSHCFRMRCHTMLLKAEGQTSIEVGSITNMSHISVNSWVKRFVIDGMAGLKTKPGRGRKPIIVKADDQEAILKIIKANRQRMQTALAEWQALSGKTVSRSTFRSFLKSLAEDINA